MQQEWWAEMLPYLPFWHDGLIHITNAQDYGSACGACRLGNHFESSDQALTYAEVARVQHMAVTCVLCLVAWKPEAGFL
jgi:hypothetical protein